MRLEKITLSIGPLFMSIVVPGDDKSIREKGSPIIVASRATINVRGLEGIHVFIRKADDSSRPPLPSEPVALPKISLALPNCNTG